MLTAAARSIISIFLVGYIWNEAIGDDETCQFSLENDNKLERGSKWGFWIILKCYRVTCENDTMTNTLELMMTILLCQRWGNKGNSCQLLALIDLFLSSILLGFEWIGWSNDSLGISGKPIELTFQFDTVRNFSAMVLHTNNMFTKGVQVSSAKLFNEI